MWWHGKTAEGAYIPTVSSHNYPIISMIYASPEDLRNVDAGVIGELFINAYLPIKAVWGFYLLSFNGQFQFGTWHNCLLHSNAYPWLAKPSGRSWASHAPLLSFCTIQWWILYFPAKMQLRVIWSAKGVKFMSRDSMLFMVQVGMTLLKEAIRIM